jgi:hypothetical protein
LELLGTLEAIAQIAIALTGFTGIVVALGERELGDWTPVDRFLLRALLYWSLGTMFLALLPSGLSTVRALPEPWRVAHGIFALFHAAVFIWFFRERSRLAWPPTRSTEKAILTVGSGVLLAEILVALGFLANLAPFLYLVALLWFLFLATSAFIELVFPRPPAQPPAA